MDIFFNFFQFFLIKRKKIEIINVNTSELIILLVRND
jgi:hypothetical protein